MTDINVVSGKSKVIGNDITIQDLKNDIEINQDDIDIIDLLNELVTEDNSNIEKIEESVLKCLGLDTISMNNFEQKFNFDDGEYIIENDEMIDEMDGEII